VLDIVHRQIEIECLPADIPSTIEVDVTELMVGQSIRVKDIATDAKWKAVTEPELMLLHVIIPKVEETPTPEAAAAGTAATPAEPEVIKKGKKEEGEAAEAAAAPAPARRTRSRNWGLGTRGWGLRLVLETNRRSREPWSGILRYPA
jgi:large subunit ribosomal protein L25